MARTLKALHARRRKAIEELTEDTSIVSNGWDCPRQPKRYLVIECDDDGPVWAYNVASPEEGASEIESSDTEAVWDRQLHDLDTGAVYTAHLRVTSFSRYIPSETTPTPERFHIARTPSSHPTLNESQLSRLADAHYYGTFAALYMEKHPAGFTATDGHVFQAHDMAVLASHFAFQAHPELR